MKSMSACLTTVVESIKCDESAWGDFLFEFASTMVGSMEKHLSSHPDGPQPLPSRRVQLFNSDSSVVSLIATLRRTASSSFIDSPFSLQQAVRVLGYVFVKHRFDSARSRDVPAQLAKKATRVAFPSASAFDLLLLPFFFSSSLQFDMIRFPDTHTFFFVQKSSLSTRCTRSRRRRTARRTRKWTSTTACGARSRS
jgi:hypothetical protein